MPRANISVSRATASFCGLVFVQCGFLPKGISWRVATAFIYDSLSIMPANSSDTDVEGFLFRPVAIVILQAGRAWFPCNAFSFT
jgi:hypothetical protein